MRVCRGSAARQRQCRRAGRGRWPQGARLGPAKASFQLGAEDWTRERPDRVQSGGATFRSGPGPRRLQVGRFSWAREELRSSEKDRREQYRILAVSWLASRSLGMRGLGARDSGLQGARVVWRWV